MDTGTSPRASMGPGLTAKSLQELGLVQSTARADQGRR